MSIIDKEQLLSLDSANRYNTLWPNANHFMLSLPTSVLYMPTNQYQYYKLTLENASIPYSFYNMDDSDSIAGSGDNYFYLIYKMNGNVEKVVELTFSEGNPTPKNLITQFNSLVLSNADLAFTITYDVYTLKFTWTVSAKAGTIEYVKFNFDSDPAFPNDETCHSFLGFAYGVTYTFATVVTTLTLLSIKPVNMSFNSPLYIRLNNLAGDNVKWDETASQYVKTQTLAVINLTNNPGSTIFYQDVGNDNMSLIISNRVLTALEVTISDRYDRLIKNLDDFQLCLKISVIEATPNQREVYQQLVLLTDEITQLRKDNIEMYNKAIQPTPQPVTDMATISSVPTDAQPFSEEVLLSDNFIEEYNEHIHLA